MASNISLKNRELTEQISEQKRPKGSIKFQLQLNEEQKQAKEKILQNAITILSGKAGSGKTLLACQVALDMLFKKEVKQIIITRPTVSKEEIGFLPGDLREKMEPWMQPVYANISHEITPIEMGTRYSLIWFIQGNNIRTVPTKLI